MLTNEMLLEINHMILKSHREMAPMGWMWFGNKEHLSAVQKEYSEEEDRITKRIRELEQIILKEKQEKQMRDRTISDCYLNIINLKE